MISEVNLMADKYVVREERERRTRREKQRERAGFK